MVMLDLGQDELINLDYIVKINRKKRIIYLNEEGIGLVPKQLTREQYHELITSRYIERKIL